MPLDKAEAKRLLGANHFREELRMPIYEFKCLKCSEFFEFLAVRSEDTMETKCPKCGAEDFERVMSTTNFAVNSSGGQGPSKQTRTCSGGNCSTYEIPGP